MTPSCVNLVSVPYWEKAFVLASSLTDSRSEYALLLVSGHTFSSPLTIRRQQERILYWLPSGTPEANILDSSYRLL